MKLSSLIILLISSLMLFGNAQAQQVRIELGPDQVAINQYFTITVTVDGRITKYSQFPEIPGFQKSGISSQSNTTIVNGRISSSQSIIQNYAPTAEGTFTLSNFIMEVNGEQVSSAGKSITVSAARQQQQRPRYDVFGDPLEDFFGGNKPAEFVDVKDDAFFAVTTSKDAVYVGEGFTMTIAFYVAESNRAPLQFHDPAKQLNEILKKLKPQNVWEENFNIENIEGQRMTLDGKNYTQYKIFQATYYPLNAQDIYFPSVPFEMIKYKVAKNPSFFGQNRKEDFKTFNSAPKRVRIKELPPHPLKDAVAVGDYKLSERLPVKEVETGQSFNYDFIIHGEGNIASIDNPSLKNESVFDFYSPNISQNINRSEGKVTGSKVFSYHAIPNEPGQYALSDYLSFIFFNPRTARYDTLKSRLDVTVSGESKKNEYILSNDLGSFYDKIELADDRMASMNKNHWVLIFSNLIVLFILVISAVLIFKK